MTDIMSIGATAIRAFTKGIATVSDNVANAQTPGYTRRGTTMLDGKIVRYADSWRDNEARIAGGAADEAATRLSWLQSAERTLDDGTTGIGQRVGAVFNRAEELAADPNSAARRSAYLQSIDDAAVAFRTTASGLKSTAEGIASQAQQTVQGFNSDLNGLLNVNQTLLATPKGTSGYASLLDQRDRLLNNMAKAIPIDITFDNRGVATVRLSGTGEIMATPDAVGQLSVATAPDGTLTFTATQTDGQASATIPSGATLAGLSRSAVDVAERRQDVDLLASKFADVINTNQANGLTSSGAPGGPLVDVGPNGALTIAALDVGTEAIATADQSSENGNLMALASARNGSGVETGWSALVSDHAQKVQSAKLVQESSQSRSQAADEARDQLSGVDLDREAVELMRLQQSYEAAARVIQVAREMLQSINRIS